MSGRAQRTQTRPLMRAASLLAPALLLAGCAATGPNLPDRPGIYAKTGGKDSRLVRLSGQSRSDWSNVTSLPGGAELLVANAGMGSDPSLFDDYVTVTRAGWVRSQIAPDGQVRPTTDQQFAAPELSEYRIDLSFSYLGQENGLDIVRVMPNSPLGRGYYEIEAAPAASRDMRARFGVQARQLDRDRYAQKNCLDRIEGAETRYRPCAADAGTGRADRGDGQDRAADDAAVGKVDQQPLQAPGIAEKRLSGERNTGGRRRDARAGQDASREASGPQGQAAQQRPIDSLAPGLHIRDLSVDRARRDDGDVLLIRGEVVNADDESHELPRLRGRIIDPGGAVLQRWTFLPNARAIEPGEAARFTTVRDATEEGGKHIEIRFKL